MFVVVLAAVAPSHDLTHTPTPSACRISASDRCHLSHDGKFLPPRNLQYAAFAFLFQLVSPNTFISHDDVVFRRICSLLKGNLPKTDSLDIGFRSFNTPVKEFVKVMKQLEDIEGDENLLFYVVYCAMKEMMTNSVNLIDYMRLALQKFHQGQRAFQLKRKVSMHSVAQCRHVFLFAMF